MIIRCWSCGLTLPLATELAYHLLANSACFYEYQADDCVHHFRSVGYLVGSAHIHWSNNKNRIEPWWVQAVSSQVAEIVFLDRFDKRQDAVNLIQRLNASHLYPLARYQQTR